MNSLYLASGSPRRRELLTQIGVPFTVVSVAIDETPLTNESAVSYVERLARGKATAGLAVLENTSDACVLGADTAVIVDGKILGKPVDQADALAMLMALAGREHEVLTAIALTDGQRCETVCVSSRVRFREISVEEAITYWHSGEPQDKAGGYAIQGAAGAFIPWISGSFTGIVGLPLAETAALLAAAGYPVWKSQ